MNNNLNTAMSTNPQLSFTTSINNIRLPKAICPFYYILNIVNHTMFSTIDDHQYFFGISDIFLPFIQILLRSSVIPFSILFILLLTQQQPAKGAEINTPISVFRNHRQYLSGIAIFYIIVLLRQINKLLQDQQQNEDKSQIKSQNQSFDLWKIQFFTFILQLFTQFQSRQTKKTMKNNYVASFSFHKKQQQILFKNTPTFLLKNTQVVQDHGDKKATVQIDPTCNQNNILFLSKQIQTTEEESINSDQPSSCKSSEITTKPSKIQHKLMREQRIISPNKYNNLSPPHAKVSTSPNLKQSTLIPNNFAPIRATLRNLIQSKGSPNHKNQENFSSLGTHSSRQLQLNSSVRANKTVTQLYQSPMKNIQKQNQILREENQLLKYELSEIKKNLLFGTSGSKKEDLISNLRNTIKKEDSEIKQLRVKLQIFTKKNAALTTLIQNKDQQITFLSNKIIQMEQKLEQVKTCKQKNEQKTQKLKDKINYLFKSYNDLQAKWNKSQVDWLTFQQKWMEEKGIYLHRISFLQEYIANN